MKKLTCFTLLFAIISICTACSAQATAAETALEMKAIKTPIEDVDSPDDIKRELGIYISAPEGASDIVYSVISDDTAQADFTFNKTSCTVRIRKAAQLEDISGVYHPFNMKAQKLTSSGRPYVAKYNYGLCGLSYWYDSSSSSACSVYMSSGATDKTLATITEAVFAALNK